MKVRWTDRATDDVLAIWDYIAAQSPTYADTVVERVLVRPNQLGEHPKSGAIVPEYDRDDIRELIVSSFRLIYRITDAEIRVLTVIHGARQLPPYESFTAER